MRTKSLGLMVGVLSLAAGVSVQAAPILLTPTANYKKDTTWQNINQTTFAFADANANNRVDVGETVTFTVEMGKEHWGRHDFDAMKVWINSQSNPSEILYSNTGKWDFTTWNNNYDYFTNLDWNGGTKSFSFDYTFTSAGQYDFTASVMCSFDLSDLVGSLDDKPTASDWNAWTRTIHTGSGWMQGETEKYKLEVYAAVPEPATLAMFLLGLAGFAGFRFHRRKK